MLRGFFNKKFMDELEKLQKEKTELNALINKGFTFEVEDFTTQTQKYFFGLIKRRELVKIKRVFKIEEPTLGTLDRLSAEWVEFAISDELLKEETGMKKARDLVYQQSKRCAKVVALAVLGSDYLIPKKKGKYVRYKENTKALTDLTDLFLRTIKPSRLYQLTVMIGTMCNLGDFCNSIRLMYADRSTMPIRIEEDSEV